MSQEIWKSFSLPYAYHKSTKNWFKRYCAQLNITPFAYYTITAMIPIGVSSFQHFLINLQDIIFLMNLVTLLLMSLSTMPMFHLSVPSCDFTSSTISFSPTLLSKYSSGYSLSVGNPVILAINATSSCTSLSIHMMSPCTQDNNDLM